MGNEEGIVVVPRGRAEDVLANAQAKATADAAPSLDDWQRRHRAAVEAALRTKGYRL